MWIPLEIMREMLISVRSLEPSWTRVHPREWVNGCGSSFWFSQFQSHQRSSDRSGNQNAFGEMSPWVVSVFEANENIFLVSRRPALTEPLPEQRLPAGRLWLNSVSWELRWSISPMSTATVTPLPQPVWIPPTPTPPPVPRMRSGQVGTSLWCPAPTLDHSASGEIAKLRPAQRLGMLVLTKPV